ncbi:hypothetical protein [Fibrella aquatilis]|nr:hypothetical protein [Fibrella aquatilis]
MNPLTGRAKFKAARQHQPDQSVPVYQVVAEFINQQEELLSLLRDANERT